MKQDRGKPQGMVWCFILQHTEVLYNTTNSVTCFLYGMTYLPDLLSNITQKALIAHLSSEPSPHQACEEEKSIL